MRLKVCWPLAASLLTLTACPSNPSTPADMTPDVVVVADETPDIAPADMPDMPADQGPVEPTAEQKLILEVEERERFALPGLKDTVQVVYTEANVPHVYAKDRLDMGYVLGFLVARDRFFVMDLQRRLAQGTLSEILGQDALESDIESRTIGMKHVTDLLEQNLSDAEREYFDAYARGINHYIDLVRSRDAKPPSELKSFKLVLGVRNEADIMKPFTARDVAAMVAVIMYQTNFETGDPGRQARFDRLATLYDDRDVANKELRKAAAIEDIWESISPLFPVASAAGFGIERPASPGSLIPGRPERPTYTAKTPRARRVNADMLQRSERRLDRLHNIFGRREEHNYGSNTWAVAGGSTKDGSGIVAGDGHLPLSVPALMYQIGLDTTVFGGGDIAQAGLLITSLPVLAVGTNGKIAWSQVNPFADIVDWYREEVQLGADGLPSASMFQGEWQPMTSEAESYEVADVPLLMSEGRTEAWPRFTTFDGRFLFDIEGVEVSDAEQPQAGEGVINLSGRQIIIRDMNGDQKIDGITFDYTAFDTTKYVTTLDKFATAKNVEEFQDLTRGLIGNMLYSAVADDQGKILFTPYQAVPCRGYLARDAQGRWLDGAHPRRLLDGTTYGGFSIPSDAEGRVDEAPGQSDPYKCAVPFEETPQAIKTQGYVLNANNQPAPITNDASLSNDPWYIGGPWRAIRADSIEQGLEEIVEEGADLASMSRLQGERRSRLGEVFTPALLTAISRAKMWSETDGPIEPHEARAAALYEGKSALFDDIAARLQVWSMAGHQTHSGVDTFYNMTTPERQADAVATMIFNAWLPRAMNDVFSDESLEFEISGSVGRFRALSRALEGRGADNPGGLRGYDAATQESVFFDDATTAEVERSDELLVRALLETIEFLSSDPTAPGEGGFGTEDPAAWLWGLRHQVRFESLLAEFLGGTDFEDLLAPFSITTETLPLAPDMMDGDPRKDLTWFPRPGDNFSVDASNPGFSGTRFTHGSGPVMRMVISVKDGRVKGHNIIPGGQSGINDSDYFADQAEKWLANETIPLRYHPEEVAEGAEYREVYEPAAD